MLEERIKQSNAEAGEENEFILKQVISAPRPIVWKALTKSKWLSHWLKPAGSELIIHKLEFTQGGTFHYNVSSPHGMLIWGKSVFLQIDEPESILFVSSFSDELGRVRRSPIRARWPLEILNVIHLTDRNASTGIILRARAIYGTEDELRTFTKEFASMRQKFQWMFNQLSEEVV